MEITNVDRMVLDWKAKKKDKYGSMEYEVKEFKRADFKKEKEIC